MPNYHAINDTLTRKFIMNCDMHRLQLALDDTTHTQSTSSQFAINTLHILHCFKARVTAARTQSDASHKNQDQSAAGK